jgi:DNA-3-methyladenine glycosylase II
MFLIFNLCRKDIFPLDDIGMIKGICKIYNYTYPIKKAKLIEIGNRWKPYRSVATWYIWRSLDPIPVEY